MGTKSLTVVRAGRYGTRDLRADDTYEATGPEARLYLKLGWMSEDKPKAVEAPAKPKRRAKKKA